MQNSCKKQLSITIASFLFFAVFATGCRSKGDYKRLAKTGESYTLAVNKLLIASGEITIEASSEQLLQEDQRKKPLNSTVTASRYDDVSQPDYERLRIIREIRNHNLLLKDYFAKLSLLAESKSPETAKTEIDGIVGNLNKVGQNLKKKDLIENPSLISGISNLIVNSRIRGVLREELEKRNKTIMEELTLQEELLKYLSKSMEKEIIIIQKIHEDRLVIQPLAQIKLIDNEDAWIENRIQILTMHRKSDELKDASEKLSEFKTMFKYFVEGKLSVKRLNQFVRDIDSFLEILEQNKKLTEKTVPNNK
mgnify:CR=1 FL=1